MIDIALYSSETVIPITKMMSSDKNNKPESGQVALSLKIPGDDKDSIIEALSIIINNIESGIISPGKKTMILLQVE
jgi:hypothetical protein